MTSTLTHLGPLTVQQFMRRVWQRQPYLIRSAFAPDFSHLRAADLLRLAQRPDVESRLITHFKNTWRLHHGPLQRSALPLKQPRNWTVLIQGLDQIDPKIHTLLQRFRFIADARLDDVMASYAVPEGSVGPHTDSYDVFLIQAHGQRRWRISQQRDTRCLENVPLKLLAQFKPSQEWVLGPGDMLYLPPGVAHEGVASSECITLSVGFRTPNWAQLAEPWLDKIAERLTQEKPYSDAGAAPTRAPACVPQTLINETLAGWKKIKPSLSDAREALLEYLTEPKPSVIFKPRARPVGQQRFAQALAAYGIELDARTRMLYSGHEVAINGERLKLRAQDLTTLRELANTRTLRVPEGKLSAPALDWLYDAYQCGWAQLKSKSPASR